MNGSFWFVWCAERDAPRHKHPSLQSAEREAERLARLNRGQRFYVLESVCAICVDDVQRTDLRPDEVPF